MARNWNVKKATKMLKETLKWRAEYKPEETRWVCYHLSPLDFFINFKPEFLYQIWSAWIRFSFYVISEG